MRPRAAPDVVPARGRRRSHPAAGGAGAARVIASEADFVEYMVGLYRKFSEPLRVAEEAPLHAEQAGIGVPDALLDGREAVLVLGAD